MFRMKIAQKTFEIKNRYPYIEKLCASYSTTAAPEYVIEVTPEEIAREGTEDGSWSMEYLESLAVYRRICELLLEENIVLFHCSAIELEGKAYLFTAPSGTGKSTHTRLWRKVFGGRVNMINDDKPLLHISPNREVTVYGTPYAGKEGLQTNTSAPVEAIVILHQAKENSIKELDGKEAYPMLLNQTYRKKDPAGMIKTMELVGQLAELPVYSLGCTISEEAVRMAYQKIVEKDV